MLFDVLGYLLGWLLGVLTCLFCAFCYFCFCCICCCFVNLIVRFEDLWLWFTFGSCWVCYCSCLVLLVWYFVFAGLCFGCCVVFDFDFD